jgi:hypothetical protein
MDLTNFIGQKKIFARACMRAFEKSQKPSVIAMVFAISILASICTFAQAEPFVYGKDSRIHAVSLDHSLEGATRQKMQILDNCDQVKARATSLPFTGSEGAALIPHMQSGRGVLVLEGLVPNANPTPLDTELLSLYKNYPTSIPGETTGASPSPRYAFALTIAATLTGEGDLVIQKGDFLNIRTDGQVYAYSLPEITIPSEGVLRLYLGTDDTLYYDAALTHPFHSGTCGSKSN